MFLVLSLFLFCLEITINNGTPQFTNCPSSVCLSQSVSYECIVNTTDGADTLRWRVLDANYNPITGAVAYAVNQPLTMSVISSDFTATLTDSSGPIVSNVTFTPRLIISNYTVECEARGTGSYTPVTCPISIAGVPAAPVPNDLNFTTNTLNFSWSPSNSTCVSHYSVNVTSIEYTINTTNTSLSLPVPSTNDTDYFISVVAVDTGGRYMDPVDERTFVADVPEFVIDLTLNQTGLSINVSWNKPPALMFLSISSYIIYHNVPDPDTSITIPAPTTTYIIPDATVGSVYTVGVAASNVLGAGPNASSIIRIMSTSVPPPTSSTSTSVTMTPSVTSSTPVVTSTSTSTQSTPATTPTTSSPSTGGSNSTVYIGIGVGVAVTVIIILIMLIIVGCLIWRKPWKGEKENTTTNTVIYDTPTDTVHVPNVPVSKNTAYGTATGSRGVVHTSDNVAYGHVSTTSNTGTRQTDTVVYEAVQ